MNDDHRTTHIVYESYNDYNNRLVTERENKHGRQMLFLKLILVLGLIGAIIQLITTGHL